MSNEPDKLPALLTQNTDEDLTRSPLRTQLLWSSFFPLALFGLLSTLVITSVFNKLSLDLVIERNAAQVQVVADHISQEKPNTDTNSPQELMGAASNAGLSNKVIVFIANGKGEVVSAGNTLIAAPLNNQQIVDLYQTKTPFSRLVESSTTNDQIMVSGARITGTAEMVFLVEPWSAIMTPATTYQWLLACMTVLGILFSLAMLSLAIGRVIRPIQILASNASEVVPGSIFHPIKEQGPQEIRSLTNAYNKMVIRLAEQQSDLRQYAHKTLISQEKERQRISHELHDGTVQDLVGLNQRVELCRKEMETDPQLASSRLEEIHVLLGTTIDDVRRISIALRPPALEDFGLVAAAQALCAEMNKLNPRCRCDFFVYGDSHRISADLELAIYRVIQEALANIRKHVPDVKNIKVEIRFGDDEVVATITNDGTAPFKPNIQESVRSGHLGLAGMYERARLFGGSFNINTGDNGLTVIMVQLPIM